MSKCSPHIASNSDNTCFDLQTLRSIAKKINKQNAAYRLSGKQNSGKQVIKIEGKSKKKLWDEIHKVMQSKCGDDEICWVKGSKFEKEMFKPPKPEGNDYVWLSGGDIEHIMKQYEKKYKDFKFFGPLPSDFNKIRTDLNKEKLEDLYSKGITRIGMIFNTDPHHKAGQHWVAFFIDMSSKLYSIEFYDSLGKPPFKSVRDYMKILKNYIKLTSNTESVLRVNTREHQRKDGQCGMFSVAFIVKRLNGKTFEEIEQKDFVMTDEGMAECRDYYFRT